jgi:hypothetical protein
MSNFLLNLRLIGTHSCERQVTKGEANISTQDAETEKIKNIIKTNPLLPRGWHINHLKDTHKININENKVKNLLKDIREELYPSNVEVILETMTKDEKAENK